MTFFHSNKNHPESLSNKQQEETNTPTHAQNKINTNKNGFRTWICLLLKQVQDFVDNQEKCKTNKMTCFDLKQTKTNKQQTRGQFLMPFGITTSEFPYLEI